jgi:23S rRNA (cytosine1962-C5)-methyltransferase
MKKIKFLYPPKGPLIFKRMTGDIPQGLKRGDVVEVINKTDEFFGYAIYNPKSSIVLRIITRERSENFSIEEHFKKSIISAIELRKKLGLPSEDTNAYRLVHDWGDSLNGITVDIFNNWAVVEIYSYGYYIIKDSVERILKELFNCINVYFSASDYTKTMEGFELDEKEVNERIKIKENGVVFEIKIGSGYKSGFFCDQRENRLYLTNFVRDKSVLDLFSYTGGFGIYAKKYGAADVTAVDLDEYAVSQLKRNANLNGVRVNAVNSDAFIYMRQLIENKKEYDVVILDPNKIITSREAIEEGVIKYIDLNKLALRLVKNGGLFVSCSCSGMISRNDFVNAVRKAASISKKVVKIFKKTGAATDHPFMINYPEGEYLKVIWSFVEQG